MYRFFIEESNIDTQEGKIRIVGDDVNHIRNVLRMKSGEQILLPAASMPDQVPEEEVKAGFDKVLSAVQKNARELPSDLYLFQALPKGDRFENVIQKCVELGVHEIIPVITARTIVKLDEKRAARKTERWNAISLAAAKQSKRAFVPEVTKPLNWNQALKSAAGLDKILVPYENAQGIAHTRQVIDEVNPGESVGIFIGPEGGFEEKEIEQLLALGAESITLGHRILRTDTASPAILAMLMLHLESDEE